MGTSNLMQVSAYFTSPLCKDSPQAGEDKKHKSKFNMFYNITLTLFRELEDYLSMT
jgi:hypothetical protein